MSDTIPKLTHEQVKKALDDVDAAYKDLLLRMPDRDGQAAYERDLLNGDMTVASMRANMMKSQEYKNKHPDGPVNPPATLAPVLHPDGRIWRDFNNAPVRIKGVTAFPLLDMYVKGKSIDGFLQKYKGFNLLRVFCYTPSKDWGANAWDVPTAVDARRFLGYVGNLGWNVELVLLTSDEQARLDWARSFVPQLVTGGRPQNLIIEIGNEPTTHKNINTASMKDVMEKSGVFYASGNYEKSELTFGKYGVAHTARDSEWPRRGHDLLEYYNGGGPNAPSDPAHKFPWCGDEPAKLQDVSGDKPNDWRAYFGVCSLLGAGATFHSETGKFGQLPTAEEANLAACALEGLNAYPADAPNGPYSRPVENSLRTYVVGNYMVRVRPTSPSPGSGWVRIGTSDIFWKKG